MGTRADFYLGRGTDAEWLGSIAWDGYPEGIRESVLSADLVEDYLSELESFLTNRDDTTLPKHGWPWPWETSHTTDFAYAFDDGAVWVACFGAGWVKGSDALNDRTDWESMPGVEFPDMSDRQNVTLGRCSGVMVIGGGSILDIEDD